MHTVYKSSQPCWPCDSTIERTLNYRNGVNTMGLVAFSILFGLATAESGSTGQIVAKFFKALFEIIMILVRKVVFTFTPIGVASIIATKVLSVANLEETIQQLAWFVGTILLGILLFQFIGLQLIYWTVTKRNPFQFYSKLIHPMMTAAACGST